MRLRSSLESPLPSLTSSTSSPSSSSSTTTNASRMSSTSAIYQHQHQHQSAVLRARFEPDVGGVNRYRHFHRPRVPSPLLILPCQQTNDDGQSIDKTSPRRANRLQPNGLLPAIVSPKSPKSEEQPQKQQLMVNGKGLTRPRAHSNPFKSAAGTFGAKIVLAAERLPQIRPFAPVACNNGTDKARNGTGSVHQPQVQQQRMTNGGGKGSFTTRRREQAEVTVRVRRRIIISDGSVDHPIDQAQSALDPPLSVIPKQNGNINDENSTEVPKTVKMKRKSKKVPAKKVMTMCAETQTEELKTEEEMPQNATPASLETSSSTESSLVPRATQTDMGNQLLPGHYLSGARSASSGVSPIGQEEFEQRSQLLAIIESALDETIDRPSRLRTNEFIASTARKQAQIWRDAKEFVTLHLFPQSIDLASQTQRSQRRDRSESMYSLEKTLRNIQLP